ncbi:MAG: hypothetical protein QM817_27890 [Archangium sp.]
MKDWRARLTAQEREHLSRPDLVALTEEQQLEWFRTNRRIGYWVTTLAGGVMVTFVLGGAAAALLFAYQRDDALLELLGSPLAFFGLWCVWKWVQRMIALRSPL